MDSFTAFLSFIILFFLVVLVYYLGGDNTILSRYKNICITYYYLKEDLKFIGRVKEDFQVSCASKGRPQVSCAGKRRLQVSWLWNDLWGVCSPFHIMASALVVTIG